MDYFSEKIPLVELEYIDRKKRLMTRAIELIVLLPLGVFFTGMIPTKNGHGHSVIGDLLKLEPYWNIVGLIGVFTVSFIYFSFWRITINKNGIIRLSTDSIELEIKGRKEIFYINSVKNLLFISDLPYESDERSVSQQASRIKFDYHGKKFDFEIRTQKKVDFDNIRPIVKYWKSTVDGYHEYYR